MNVHGVFLQDIYLLSYCGIKVIFQVCKTYERSVCLIELATKKYKNGISLWMAGADGMYSNESLTGAYSAGAAGAAGASP